MWEFLKRVIMNSKLSDSYENKILIGLVHFVYEIGYKSVEYMDPDNGGIYENKLESRLNLNKGGDSPSPEFIFAAKMLEAKGYVRRIKRNPDSNLMGIWPTHLGLTKAEYLQANYIKKGFLFLKANGGNIIVSAITTIIVLLITWLFKLFGLGQ